MKSLILQIVDFDKIFYEYFYVSYNPLEIKTVIVSENLFLKNAVNNPGYASLLHSQAKSQIKDKADTEQNRPNTLPELSREEEKIRRKQLGEDNINYQSSEEKEERKEKSEKGENQENIHVVENGKGDNIDIIV